MVEDRSCTKKAKYTYKKWQVDLSRKKYRFIVCPIAMLGFFAHKLKSLPRKNRLTVFGHLSLVKRKRDPFWKLRARKCLFSLVSNFIFISGRGKRLKLGIFTMFKNYNNPHVRPLHYTRNMWCLMCAIATKLQYGICFSIAWKVEKCGCKVNFLLS